MGAFIGCKGITAISLPFTGSKRNATNLDALLGYVFGTTDYEGSIAVTQKGSGSYSRIYYFPEKLSSVQITDQEEIKYRAFSNCAQLTNIGLPSVVKEIGIMAFEGCTGIETLVLPEGLLSISNNAFKNSGIKNIVIPNSVTSLVSKTFEDCSMLQVVCISSTTINIANDAFGGLNGQI